MQYQAPPVPQHLEATFNFLHKALVERGYAVLNGIQLSTDTVYTSCRFAFERPETRSAPAHVLDFFGSNLYEEPIEYVIADLLIADQPEAPITDENGRHIQFSTLAPERWQAQLVAFVQRLAYYLVSETPDRQLAVMTRF